MKVHCTSELSAQEGIRALIYGRAGIGKTSLIPTCEKPIILSAEQGLQSISNHQIPYIIIQSWDDFVNALRWLYGNQGEHKTIVIDSLSQIVEMLFEVKKTTCLTKDGKKDGLRAYGETGEDTRKVFNEYFRVYLKSYDIVAFAKLSKEKDDQERLMYAPLFVGTKIGLEAPHAFDVVGALRDNPDGSRYIMTQSDGLWQAKARTPYDIGGMHEPNVSKLFNKIRGLNNE